MVLISLKEINEKVEVISTNQSKFNLHLLPSEKVISQPKGMPTLPLKTMSELNKMESYLKEDDHISDLACYLSAYVSTKPEKEYQSAMKVMASLMENSLGKFYNFEGRKGKQSFQDLTLWKAVKEAIMWKLDNSDFAEAKKGVMKWLIDAPWRSQSDGSQPRSRLKSKNTSNTNSPRSKGSPKSKGSAIFKKSRT